MKSFKVPRKGDILGLDIEGSGFSERFAAGAHMGEVSACEGGSKVFT